MASLLPSIGAAESLGRAALPGALKAVHAIGKGLSFAANLDQKLADVTGEGALLSEIAGLLQNGTPMATIVDRVAKQLGDALVHAGAGVNPNDPKTRSTLQRALAGALAPPGTSPPQSNGELAATLEKRLQNLLTTLTSTPATAGQQNEFSGKILDAVSAKETPAQQKDPTSTTLTADAVNAFAQALLQKTAAGLTPGASPAPAQTAPTSSSTSTGTSDILTRILTRAANADAQRGGHVLQPASGTTNSTTASPSAVFQRLVAIIAQHGGTQADANADKQFSQNPASDQTATQANSPAQTTQTNLPATPAFSVQSAPVSAAAAPAQPAVPQAAVDPQAIIEQLVKGIIMRNSGATSELRMRLQPDHLGDVSLKLTVTGNNISANVVAQSAHVRDLLLSNQQQLARSLSAAGLSLGNFSVDVSGGNGGYSQQQAQHQRASARPGAFDSVSSSEEQQWTDPRFGPSLLPAGKSLVLNYLV